MSQEPKRPQSMPGLYKNLPQYPVSTSPVNEPQPLPLTSVDKMLRKVPMVGYIALALLVVVVAWSIEPEWFEPFGLYNPSYTTNSNVDERAFYRTGVMWSELALAEARSLKEKNLKEPPTSLDWSKLQASHGLKSNISILRRWTYRPPVPGVRELLASQLPGYTTVVDLTPVGYESYTGGVTMTYRVTIKVKDALHAAQAMPVTEAIPEVAKFAQIAQGYRYVRDLPQGYVYHLPSSMRILSNEGTLTFLWRIGRVEETEKGWLLASPDPTPLSQKAEVPISVVNSHPFRIRSGIEIVSIESEQRSQAGLMLSRVQAERDRIQRQALAAEQQNQQRLFNNARIARERRAREQEQAINAGLNLFEGILRNVTR